jgi:hypothetical protein
MASSVCQRSAGAVAVGPVLQGLRRAGARVVVRLLVERGGREFYTAFYL